MSDKNRITPSKKEIYTKLLDIAEKYTDIKDSDFLKTGFFGYMNEAMAMMMRDSTYHKSMLYNESFLNTAIIPRSVYNWAKMFNIEVQKATPAYAEIEIRIPADNLSTGTSPAEIDRYGSSLNAIVKPAGESGEGYPYFIINKEDPIIAGDYYFSLEDSILIYKSSGPYIARTIPSEYVSTKFEESSLLNKRSNNSTKFFSLHTEGNGQAGGTDIVVKAKAYQYMRQEKQVRITSSSFLNRIQRFQFTGQFCGAKLFVLNNGKREVIELRYSDIIGTIGEESDVKYAFYNLTSDNEIELIFKDGPGMFIPTPATKLLLFIYTTNGESVPTKYNAETSIIFSDTKSRNKPAIVRFNPANIVGGKNAPSLDKIKSKIINEISTRNTVSTETDLNSYFNKITMLIEDINDGKVRFIKQRDDILRRIFNAYVLLRDNCDESGEVAEKGFISPCVPTTTLDVNFVIDNAEDGLTDFFSDTKDFPRFSESGITGSDGNVVIYGTESTVIDGNNGYICPFILKFSNNPFKYAQYIFDLVDQKSGLSLDTGDIPEDNLLLNPIDASIYRGISSGGRSEAFYTLSFKFNTDSDTNLSILDNENPVTLNIGNSISWNISKNYVSVSSEAVGDSNETLFETTVSIQLDVEEFDSDQITLSIGEQNAGSVSEEEAISVEVLGHKFKVDDKLTFFQHMDDVMHSDISITTTEDNSQTIITLKEVPVVHLSFFNSQDGNSLAGYEERWNGFTKQLFTYIKCLKENLERLETSTFYSIKFYNTYGASVKYTTPTTNIKLMLKITLLDAYKENLYLMDEIRSYIRRIIDRTNEGNSGIKVSTIISMLTQEKTYGSYIDHIDFLGLNDTFTQFIEPLEVEDDIGYPPEWLNLEWSSLEEQITFK